MKFLVMKKLLFVFALLLSISVNAQKYVFKVNYIATRTKTVWSEWIDAKEASSLIIIDKTNKKFTMSSDNSVNINIIYIGDKKQDKDTKGSYYYQDLSCIVPENGGLVSVEWKKYLDGENVFMLLYTGGDGLGFSCRELK